MVSSPRIVAEPKRGGRPKSSLDVTGSTLRRPSVQQPEPRGFDLVQWYAFKSEEMAEESGEVAPRDGGLLPVEGGEEDVDGPRRKRVPPGAVKG
jgi:hypothetical protein